MASSSGLSVSDMPIKGKLEYEDFMNGKTNQIKVNNRVFKWE